MIGSMTQAIVALALLLFAAPAHADDALWERLKQGGHYLMLRHATAPGTYDPPGYRLDDCSTQRNLSGEGREEARALGATLRANGVPIGRVLSSRWCRCLETARLAFGRVEPWPALDSLRRGEEDARTREMRALVSTPLAGPNVVLVTHQFNIRAATGLPSIQSGETIVLAPLGDAGFRVAGRIAAPGGR
jgi:broad specificity phosphatase PhoE